MPYLMTTVKVFEKKVKFQGQGHYFRTHGMIRKVFSQGIHMFLNILHLLLQLSKIML